MKNKISYGAIVILAVVARLIPHAPNFAPIGALAIFSGAKVKNKLAWMIPISAMMISDIFLGFHKTIPFVYASFIIASFIGSMIKKDKWHTLALASLTSSLIFFIVTNFGVFVTGTMYAKNVSGLMQCYIMALPFFRNTILSDFIYTFSFFYGFKYLNLIVRKFALSKV